MEKEIVKTPTLAPAFAPYAPGVKVKKAGSMVFISGVVQNDVDGKILFKGDISKQTKQVQKNLNITLEAAGTTFDDVVKITS